MQNMFKVSVYLNNLGPIFAFFLSLILVNIKENVDKHTD